MLGKLLGPGFLFCNAIQRRVSRYQLLISRPLHVLMFTTLLKHLLRTQVLHLKSPKRNTCYSMTSKLRLETSSALAFIHPRIGSALSLAGIASMLGLLHRAWLLSRDQAMLELIPSPYELALKLSTSRLQSRS